LEVASQQIAEQRFHVAVGRVYFINHEQLPKQSRAA